MQPCGVAGLMSAVFGKPLEDMFPMVGLELCPFQDAKANICGRAGRDPSYYPYCLKHKKGQKRYPNLTVPLVCEECEILFYRPQIEVINSAKHGQQHIFCGRSCWASWSGTNFGWGVQSKAKPRKTHCLRGHEFTEGNTYLAPPEKVHRRCRACMNARSLARYYERKNLVDKE